MVDVCHEFSGVIATNGDSNGKDNGTWKLGFPSGT